jgi:hypothetical protein
MNQVETGMPTPEPFLVGFLDLKLDEKINLKAYLAKTPGKDDPVVFVDIHKTIWSDQERVLFTATPERIEETRE